MEERAILAFRILREEGKNTGKLTTKQAVSKVTQLGYIWDKGKWVRYQQAPLVLTFAEAVAYLHEYDKDPLGNLVLAEQVERFNEAIKTISEATGLNETWVGGVLFNGDETIESLQAAAQADPDYAKLDNPFETP